MNEIEKKAKALIYKAAQAVEVWRAKHRGNDPVILMTAPQIATVAMGAPGVIDVDKKENRGTILGCYLDVLADSGDGEARIYLAEEIRV